MKKTKNFDLSSLTSFGTGGRADLLIEVDTADELIDALAAGVQKPISVLGYGTNSLVSDSGLRGTCLIFRGKEIFLDKGGLLVAEAGVSWDEVVEKSVGEGLWGLELMSGIPGGIGAAVVGNIAAYGQAVKDSLVWVEAIDRDDPSSGIVRISASEIGSEYRYSDFLNEKLSGLIIVRATFKLSRSKTTDLVYSSTLEVAGELGLDHTKLADRRKIIIETRSRAGSLLEAGKSKTAGSFFKNPRVASDKIDSIIAFDESGVAKKQIFNQQKVHGGFANRVSASLVLLAAGFKRGQRWGDVRLHPNHVLKLENVGDASSQDIYDVAQEIIKTVKKKLGVDLEPEARFLGKFN